MIPSVLGNDLPNGGYYRWFDEYADQHDTPQNRAVLVELMADAAADGLRRVTPGSLNELRTAIGHWLDNQSGDEVLEWLAEQQIVPTYERWAEEAA